METSRILIQNKIRTDGDYKQRILQCIKYIMIHRFGSHELAWFDEQKIQPTADGVVEFFQTCAITGNKTAYPLITSLKGTISQTRKLTDITPHAYKCSPIAIGWAWLGDFRFSPPNDEAWRNSVDVAAKLLRAWPHLKIVGHTSVPGATRDEKKHCPGKLLDVEKFEQEARAIALADAGKDLIDIGLTF